MAMWTLPHKHEWFATPGRPHPAACTTPYLIEKV